MRYALTLLSLLVLAGTMKAATITADSCSRNDVSNAVFSASNGDTVIIPAGTCDWSGTFFLTNKAIRLTGAGVGSTIIRDTSSAGTWIKIWLQSGLTTEIDNIEFRYVSGFASDRIYIEGLNTDNRNLNLHHCKFDGFTSMTTLLTDTVTGVIHHNNFWNCGLIAHVKASYYDGTFGTRDYGNQSIFAGDLFGTTNFIFFEDNFVTNTTSAIDAQAGGRYVYRWNTNYNFSPQTHGSEAAERSGRAFEVYNNIFYGNGSLANAAFYRGGVTLLYSNTWSNWPVGTTFNLVDNRILEHLFPPFGGASGVNVWDTNSATGIFDSGTVANTGGPLNNTITDFTKTWTPDQYKHYQLVRTSGKTVTSLTRSGSTATANVVGHGFTNTAWVSFWGANEYGWNVVFHPITVTDADNFTFAVEYAFPTPATGTIKCSIGNNFARILSNTATNITFANSLYDAIAPSSLRLTNADTYEIRRVIACMDQVGLYGGTNFLTTAYPDAFNNLAHFQTVSPCYQWSNNFLDTVIAWTTTFAGGGDYAHIISGKHYSNNAAKPGYIPYPYPHYLNVPSQSTPVIPRGFKLNRVKLRHQ